MISVYSSIIVILWPVSFLDASEPLVPGEQRSVQVRKPRIDEEFHKRSGKPWHSKIRNACPLTGNGEAKGIERVHQQTQLLRTKKEL